MIVLGKQEKLLGVVGLFKEVSELMKAAHEAKNRGFKRCDAFTPFPIHGLDKVLGNKRSKIPWVTLVFALIGCVGGLGLQIWTSAIAWPINVGGKPFNSLPAFVPIAFECTILLGGLATAVALFAACRLPDFHTHILDPDLTHDSFALYVPAKEEGFQQQDVENFLKQSGAYEVKLVG